MLRLAHYASLHSYSDGLLWRFDMLSMPAQDGGCTEEVERDLTSREQLDSRRAHDPESWAFSVCDAGSSTGVNAMGALHKGW
jgi:hypothetical protein